MEREIFSGKIYRIFHKDNPKVLYIGSTNNKFLLDRWSSHIRAYIRGNKFTTAHIIFDRYGLDGCNIELIKDVGHNNINHLRFLEGALIRELKLGKNNFECVNHRIDRRSSKQWFEDNKEKVRKYKKEYYEKNKEKWLKKD